MTVKVGICGFGRIGRLVARAIIGRPGIQLTAVNDLADIKTASHLFKYDSVHGAYQGGVETGENTIQAGGCQFRYLKIKDPAQLPWRDLGVDIVIESTGVFRSREKAGKHLEAGASKVIITAPAKGDVDLTVVMGVNHKSYSAERHAVVSNASCTTNCLAPVAKVLLEAFGIEKGMMNTIHSYTNDQRVLDLEHDDLRRARAAALSMIPTTTGAATAVGLVLPALQGKLDGLSIRVPTPNVSLVDFTVELSKAATVDAINQAFKNAAESELKGILRYTEEELVSRDYNGESCSGVVDGPLTMVMGERMAKVIAWYDNEWAYSLRVADLAQYMASFMK